MAELFTPDATWEQFALPDADIARLRSLPLPARALHALTVQTAWRQDDIMLFGKPVRQPRLHAWHGDANAAYTYSGLRNAPLPWTPLLSDIKQRVEAACSATFNSVLLNLYRDQQDSMGMHADDERALGPAPVIASLSLGATRRFILKHRSNRQVQPVRLDLADGDLLLMKGMTQANWKHGLPKQRANCEPRLNLTFRSVWP